MFFDLETLDYAESYRLLVSTVVPRPIALVTTLDEDGTVNAAPFSFFNVMGHDPPTLESGRSDVTWRQIYTRSPASGRAVSTFPCIPSQASCLRILELESS
jgi:hypothetical protein